MSDKQKQEHMRFVSTNGVPTLVALRSGGTLAITNDKEGTPTPPVFQAEAIKLGCVPLVMALQQQPSHAGARVELTKDQLIDKAIRDMVGEGASSAANAERLFTKDGRPDANMLSSRVGFNVTSTMRDEAWEKFNADAKKAADEAGETNPNDE